MNFSSPYFAEKSIAWQGGILRNSTPRNLEKNLAIRHRNFQNLLFVGRERGIYGENLSIDWKAAAQGKSYLAQRQSQKKGRHRHAHYGSNQAAVFSQLAASEGHRRWRGEIHSSQRQGDQERSGDQSASAALAQTRRGGIVWMIEKSGAHF